MAEEVEGWAAHLGIESEYSDPIIYERNQKLSMRDRVRKIQLAVQHDITVRELDAMLGWYAKHRGQGRFPNDPRTLSKGELMQWFE